MTRSMRNIVDSEKTDVSKRHSATKQIMQFLEPNPHLPYDLKAVAIAFQYFSLHLLEICPTDGPELTVGLRKLLESKDCFVRHTLASRKEVDRG